jgi:hypothetical protein
MNKRPRRTSGEPKVRRELRWLRASESADAPPVSVRRRIDPSLRASMIALVTRTPPKPVPEPKRARAKPARVPPPQPLRRRPALKLELLLTPRGRLTRNVDI